MRLTLLAGETLSNLDSRTGWVEPGEKKSLWQTHRDQKPNGEAAGITSAQKGVGALSNV